MTRQQAIDLAQRKANDWRQPYRVLRCLSRGDEQHHKIEPSDSFDSPPGWRLVEVIRPQEEPSTHVQ